MSTSPPAEAPAAEFVCGSERWMHSACDGLPFYKEHGAKGYCILHYPGEKNPSFGQAVRKKLGLKDYDFGGVWFPDDALFFDRYEFTAPATFALATFGAGAYFTAARFGADADFSSARFDGDANFNAAAFDGTADFRNAQFNGKADLSEVRFAETANFIEAAFRADADFSYARFRGDADFTTTFGALANFNYARFAGEAYFRAAHFRAEANFRSATFGTYARFGGGGSFARQSSLDFQFARIEKPEHVSFDRLALRPHWFVNADPRKFDFVNAAWPSGLAEEVAALKAKGLEPPHSLLATACRHLAVNAEENHRYEEASRFRYMAMDARRLEKWHGLAFWTLDWWYWLASGYGERILRALVVFLILWLGFAALYSLPEPVRCPEGSPRPNCIGWDTREKTSGFFAGFPNSAVYAIEAMTLQKPEPRPATPPARLAVLFCTVLGPVQAALLALAIRRKFMR